MPLIAAHHPGLPPCSDINLSPCLSPVRPLLDLVKETTGYYSLAAEVIQIPKPAEWRGRGKGLTKPWCSGMQGMLGLGHHTPHSLHSVGQVKRHSKWGQDKIQSDMW